jgi:hypothetical protein
MTWRPSRATRGLPARPCPRRRGAPRLGAPSTRWPWPTATRSRATSWAGCTPRHGGGRCAEGRRRREACWSGRARRERARGPELGAGSPEAWLGMGRLLSSFGSARPSERLPLSRRRKGNARQPVIPPARFSNSGWPADCHQGTRLWLVPVIASRPAAPNPPLPPSPCSRCPAGGGGRPSRTRPGCASGWPGRAPRRRSRSRRQRRRWCESSH